jgi:hypothetical protein
MTYNFNLMNQICRKLHTLKKISIKSLFILLKKAQAVVQKTSRKNVTSAVLIFFFFSVFLMDVVGGKTTINLQETYAHRKRARGALSRERMFELRQ